MSILCHSLASFSENFSDSLMEFPLYVTSFFLLLLFFFLKTGNFSINKRFWVTRIKGTSNNKGRAGARGGVSHSQSRTSGHAGDWCSCGWEFLPQEGPVTCWGQGQATTDVLEEVGHCTWQ